MRKEGASLGEGTPRKEKEDVPGWKKHTRGKVIREERGTLQAKRRVEVGEGMLTSI